MAPSLCDYLFCSLGKEIHFKYLSTLKGPINLLKKKLTCIKKAECPIDSQVN